MRFLRGATLVVLAVWMVLGGCTRGSTSSRPPIHLNPNMDRQPKAQAQEASEFFYDGAAMRRPVEGTVPRGSLEYPNAFHTGRTPGGGWVTANPLAGDDVVARGADRYAIYCTVCHGERGDGQGVMRQRSGLNSANLLETRLREMPEGQMFDVVTHGLGLMKGYAYPIPARDRWAILAYVRRLQAENPAPDAPAPSAQVADAAEPMATEPAASEGGTDGTQEGDAS